MDARPWSPTAALAEQLAAVGVRTRFETPRQASRTRRRRHAWFAGWHADYPDPDGFYLGLLELGLPLYRDEETDAVLAQARASRDRDERLRLYREFERIWIGQRAALVPLSYARQLCCAGPNVHGLTAQPDGVFHLEQVVVDTPACRPRSQLRIVNGSVEVAPLPWTSAAWTSRLYLSFGNAALFQSWARM